MLHVVSILLSLVAFGVSARNSEVINCLTFSEVVHQEFLENVCFYFLLCIKIPFKPLIFFFLNSFLRRKK